MGTDNNISRIPYGPGVDMDNLKKIKPKWIIIFGVLLLVIFGVSNNPDRKFDSAYQEYQEIAEKSQQAKIYIQKLFLQYDSCFEPNKSDIENKLPDFFTECVYGLEKIKEAWIKDKQTLPEAQSFYKNYKELIGEENRIFLENNLKLLSSKEYNDVYNGTLDVINAYLDMYIFMSSEINTDGIDDATTEDERIEVLARGIANHNFKRNMVIENLENLDANLALKKEMLKRYMEANFSEEFVHIFGM